MKPTPREAYIDWLRILAIIAVVFFHSAMPYVKDEWHIKNTATSNILLEFNFFISRFRMPLLFFISGAVTHIMLRKRTPLQFIVLRCRRLLIPLLFGMVVLVPVQVYLERVNQGYHGNFFQFFPSVFTSGFYPKGNLSWHHLWFLAYLFTYDVVCAPLLKWWTGSEGLKNRLDKLAIRKRLYWLMVPSTLWFSLLAPRFPQTDALINDPCWAVYWLLFLLAGFCCFHAGSLMDSLERNRRTSLLLAFLSSVALNYVRWNQLEPSIVFSKPLVHWQTYLYLSLYPLTAWLWVFGAVGYGRKYLNRKVQALHYMNRAVYPFYILHQTIIVILSFYVVQTSDTILMKYLFTVGCTFLICLLLYHLIILRSRVLRLLFGVKREAGETKKCLDLASITVQQESALWT